MFEHMASGFSTPAVQIVCCSPPHLIFNAPRDKCLTFPAGFFLWGKALCSLLMQEQVQQERVEQHPGSNENSNNNNNNDRGTRPRYWADLVDPCSGFPALGASGGTVYCEVDAMQMLLRYPMTQAGFCNILRHPSWGTHIYPASIFTNAPLPVLMAAIDTVNKKFASGQDDS